MKVFAMVMVVAVWSAGPPKGGLDVRDGGPPDQPPLKLRRSAEALAKAEGRHYVQVVQALRPAVSQT